MNDTPTQDVAQTPPDLPKRRRRGIPTWLWQLVLALAVVALGAVGAVALIKAKKPPAMNEDAIKGALVDVQPVHVRNVQMTVEGYGTVRPRVQVQVVPQVSGKVIYVDPNLVEGGFIPSGRALIQLERTDYELAVHRANAALSTAQSAVLQAQAGIDQATTQLQLEQAEADVAKSEWQRDNPDKPADPLVLREPQIKRAKAMVSSAEAQHASALAAVKQAEAAVAEAKLNLGRTHVAVPYDARVLNESVDLGQYIAPGQPIATLYGVEKVEITLPVDDRELAWFDLPLDGEGGSPVEVIAEFAGGEHTWQGRIARMGGQVDVKSRLVPVVVEVERPFDRTGGRPALVPGMFVKVVIRGRTVEGAVAVPRSAVHDGRTVWVVRDNVLHILHLDITRADRETAYFTSGLHDGDLVVTSLLDTITDGMNVRTTAEAAENSKPEIRNSNDETDANAPRERTEPD